VSSRDPQSAAGIGVRQFQKHAALGYFYDHREEIEAELAGELAAMEAADKAPATILRLRLRLLTEGRASQV
jgi:hypothetical protein